MTCLASCRPASECWIACFHSNDTIGMHVRVCAQMRIYVCVCAKIDQELLSSRGPASLPELAGVTVSFLMVSSPGLKKDH